MTHRTKKKKKQQQHENVSADISWGDAYGVFEDYSAEKESLSVNQANIITPQLTAAV